MTQATQSPPRNLTLTPQMRARIEGVLHDVDTKLESLKGTKPLRTLAEGAKLLLAIVDAQEQVIARLQGGEVAQTPEAAPAESPAPRGRPRRQEQS